MKAFCGATMDSRLVKPGMLFVALKGENTDGRKFIPQALAAGAAGIIEGREALAAAAKEYRQQLKAHVVGITGSAGKTTTKEWTAAFLATLKRPDGSPVKVHATQGNFNNDLGLPLTILNCPADADFLVLEMGTNHPGEIAYLVDIAAPEAGLISSIGTAHIEFFKTLDGTADEKGTLFRVLPKTGFAVLGTNNARYERLAAMCANTRLVCVAPDDAAGQSLAAALAARFPGAHNVSNARVAFGCAEQFGAQLEDCVRALAGSELPGDRWRVSERAGVTYISDCYNANPTSMEVALRTFGAQPCKGRRIAVLGDMFELGPAAAELHAQAGRQAREAGVDVLVAVGPMMTAHARGDICCADAEAARETLAALVRPNDAVLVKASHGMHLEKVILE